MVFKATKWYSQSYRDQVCVQLFLTVPSTHVPNFTFLAPFIPRRKKCIPELWDNPRSMKNGADETGHLYVNRFSIKIDLFYGIVNHMKQTHRTHPTLWQKL